MKREREGERNLQGGGRRGRKEAASAVSGC